MRGVAQRPAGTRRATPCCVTGCSTGLGLETALHLAGAGFRGLRDRARPRPAQRGAAGRRRARREPRGAAARPDRSGQHRATPSARSSTPTGGDLRAWSTTAGSACAAASRTARPTRSAGVFETNVLGTIAVTQGRAPAHARGRLRPHRHRLVGRRPRLRLRRDDLLREQVRAGGARRGPGGRDGARSGSSPSSSSRGSSRPTRWSRHRGDRPQRRWTPSSPYHDLFWASEAEADSDRRAARARGPADVARRRSTGR